ncbi:MAG: type I DNA topoisomerase [Vampirovibrionales bacterium]|nr:type I DNA topoisomerase [Vampirovibrionales bacterium]
MKHVVVVESPAKAQTINKYLGADYTVLASYGHIRDLPSKNGSVLPDNNFEMAWELDKQSEKRVVDIERALKQSDTLILATDPDREGEAISWHVLNVLKERGTLKDKPVQRVVFNEITKTAILKAMDNPREIDTPLVNAYLARRALDYLVGFTLSPILWRKLPGSRSAGRVQSVALRLVCEREAEIEAFITQEYWSVEALLATQQQQPVPTRLTTLFGQKLDKLSLTNEAMATEAVTAIQGGTFTVEKVEKKTVRRNPFPPFITSSLQMEASRKLGFSATRTMQTAQRLYEGIELGGETTGLITYMRTDGVNLAAEAVMSVRDFIKSNLGDKYLPSSPRMYKSKQKNAQEAHEAIRPTDIKRTPEKMKGYLNEDQAALYELIWRRTLACQMEQAVLDQVGVDITSPHAKGVITLRASGSTLVFDGFYRIYKETKDESPAKAVEGTDDDGPSLPVMTEGQALTLKEVTPEQHFTKPPPRYSEATMVKVLEEYGIGRPSTYASIIRVLQDRNYVRMEQRRFVPEDRGRLVTEFLSQFFKRYVEYDFTAGLEEQLDSISDDQADWHDVLTQFWTDFKAAVGETSELTITHVLDALDEGLAQHFFKVTEDNPTPRKCTSCEDGRLGLKLGKFGAFIGCSNYPECKVTKQLKSDGDDGGAEFSEGPKTLGMDPVTSKPVYVCKGPYGFYLQLGDVEELPPEEATPVKPKKTSKAADAKPKKEAKKPVKPKKPKVIKPHRSTIPKEIRPAEITLEQALKLLSLPRLLGVHPESGETIEAGLGRFGPYLKQGPLFVSLKAEDDVLTVDLQRALEVIVASGKRIINVGEINGKPALIQKSRFGYYIKHGTTLVNLPKGTDPDTVTLEQAAALIEKKSATTKSGGKTGARATKASGKTTKATSKTTKKSAPTKPNPYGRTARDKAAEKSAAEVLGVSKVIKAKRPAAKKKTAARKK